MPNYTPTAGNSPHEWLAGIAIGIINAFAMLGWELQLALVMMAVLFFVLPERRRKR